MAFASALMIYIFLVCILGIVKPNIKMNFTGGVFLSLLLLIYFLLIYNRPYFFRDTLTYEQFFNNVGENDLLDIDIMQKGRNINVEYGFVCLMYFFKKIGFSFRMFSCLISLFSFLIIYKFSDSLNKSILNETNKSENYKKNIFVFMAMYMFYFGTFYNFVTIRSILSMSLIFIGISDLIRKNTKKSIVFFFIAFLIHRISILSIVIAFLFIFDKPGITKKDFLFYWVLLGVLIFFSYYVSDSIFNIVWSNIPQYISKYISFESFFRNKVETSLFRFSLFLCYWLNGIVFYLNYTDSPSFLSCSKVYLLSLILCVLFSRFVSAYRIVDYLYVFTVPLNYHYPQLKDITN